MNSYVVKEAVCSSCADAVERSGDAESFDAFKGRLRENGWYVGNRGCVLCPECAAAASKRRNSTGRVERVPFIVEANRLGLIGEDVAVAYLGASVKRWAALRDEYLEEGTVDGEVPAHAPAPHAGSGARRREDGTTGGLDGDEVR